MALKEIDKKAVAKMGEKELRSELLTAITIIRKISDDVPSTHRRMERYYSKRGHVRVVNFLRGFLNVWERKVGDGN